MDTNTQKTYTTSDFYLGGFLIASSCPLKSYSRDERRTFFEFEQTEKLSALIEDYYSDNADVKPLRYGNALKNLKALIYGGRANAYTNNNGQQTK